MALLEGLSLWQLILVVFLLVIPILYQTNRAFKYYFKLGTYYTLALTSGFGVVFFSLPRPKNPSNHKFVAASVKYIIAPILGVEMTVRDDKYLKTDTPAIIVINHQSSIDMLPMFKIWPENCVSLAKRQLLYLSGTFGLGAWMCGTIYIDRLNHESARKTMESTANLIKTKRLKVAIFPEGTRNHKGSMLPFKKGAFHLAVQAQVPIIPIVISSYETFYSKPEKRFDEGKVIVQILPPIPSTGLTSADVTGLTEKTRDLMLQTFDRISEEVKTLK